MSHSILIKSESRFPIKRKQIKKLVARVLKEQGVVSQVELSISFIGKRKMRSLNREYREIDQPTSVLSFSLTEKRAGEKFIIPADQVLRLGDIVICYQEAQRLASEEQVLVDEEIDHLIKHGLLHLLGIHHI